MDSTAATTPSERRDRRRRRSSLQLVGVCHEPEEGERGKAGQGGEDPRQVHPGPQSDDERGRGDAAQTAQQDAEAAARLVTAQDPQVGTRFRQADGLGPVQDADPLVVAALIVVDVGRRRVLGRPQQDELGARAVRHRRGFWPGRTTWKRRVEPVRRRDRLRASVLEQLELMMEALDRPDTLSLAEPSPNARRQDYHP